jgi:hypothetical protein
MHRAVGAILKWDRRVTSSFRVHYKMEHQAAGKAGKTLKQQYWGDGGRSKGPRLRLPQLNWPYVSKAMVLFWQIVRTTAGPPSWS